MQYKNISKLLLHISIKRRLELLKLFFLMLLASIAEVVSIGLTIPFLAILIDPNILWNNAYVSDVLIFVGFNAESKLVGFITLGFIIAVISAGLIKAFLAYSLSRIGYLIGSELSTKIISNVIYQPYSIQIRRNSSEVISNATEKVNVIVTQVVMPILNMFSSAMLIMAITITLFIVNAKVTILLIGFVGSIYVIVSFFVKKRLTNNGMVISSQAGKRIRILQNSLIGIRELILNNSRKSYIETFSECDFGIRKAQAQNAFLGMAPRYFVESYAIALIALSSYFAVSSETNSVFMLPVLGAIALGAQRLLPLSQQIFISWSGFKSSDATVKDILSMLDMFYGCINSKKHSFKFSNKIELSNISFSYNYERGDVLKDVKLVIAKGEKVGFLGKSGSGKSTLLDMISGLLSPTTGEISVDGLSMTNPNIRLGWMDNISYVSQRVYLTEGSIYENITLENSQVPLDLERLNLAVDASCVKEFLVSMPDGLDTLVGENGISLSGGQIQRIGIARAIYRNSNVLILDEATSALDTLTENNIYRNILKLYKNKTLLIISHKPDALFFCDSIYRIENMSVSEVV